MKILNFLLRWFTIVGVLFIGVGCFVIALPEVRILGAIILIVSVMLAINVLKD